MSRCPVGEVAAHALKVDLDTSVSGKVRGVRSLSCSGFRSGRVCWFQAAVGSARIRGAGLRVPLVGGSAGVRCCTSQPHLGRACSTWRASGHGPWCSISSALKVPLRASAIALSKAVGDGTDRGGGPDVHEPLAVADADVLAPRDRCGGSAGSPCVSRVATAPSPRRPAAGRCACGCPGCQPTIIREYTSRTKAA